MDKKILVIPYDDSYIAIPYKAPMMFNEDYTQIRVIVR